MKMNTAVRLLKLLPVGEQHAISIADLAVKWYGRELERSDIRNIQRYMNDLAMESEDGPALVEIVEGTPRRFYLKLSQVVDWLMTEQTALNTLLTRQVIGQALGSLEEIGGKKLIEVAEVKVVDASAATKNIRERVRIVSDGFGRLPADIKPTVLQAVIDSIVQQRQLNFTYVSSAGVSSMVRASPQGLVAKDGTIYLLATKGLGDKPGHFPLHRMSAISVDHRALQKRPDFDLDRYILDSNQLSHTLGSEETPVELKLRVAPGTLYHFRERPLSRDQKISPSKSSDGWCVVTASVRFTLLLVPFLLSMGGWIEVLGPQQVRDEIAERVRAMTAHY